jgi:hypothetical protein
MKSAAEEVCAKKGTVDSDDTIPVDCGISCDGSWQRRGHSSLNGCVTIISMETGKVLDVEALTSHCKECKYYEKLDKNSKEYREWKANHTKCKAITEDLLRLWNQKELYECLKDQWKRIICDTQIFMVMGIVKVSLK